LPGFGRFVLEPPGEGHPIPFVHASFFSSWDGVPGSWLLSEVCLVP
jgi:hypothetical protein